MGNTLSKPMKEAVGDNSGQDCKTADENLGCSGYTNQGKVDPVNLKHMKGSGNKNFPNSVKDTFEHSAEYKSKVIPKNDQIPGSSKNTIEDRQMQIHGLDEEEIYNALNNRNTIKIPDLEDDMGDPMTRNTEMYVEGSSSPQQ
ncbi:Hypothetical predicted protein [Mytilus galloprovincialis]|uniref:Uncharacterized protein n=1 Tax=Mytilus galloprovincialis TaxID=29158 RepID=A0A8B6G8T1_MYTGA|nr:Hypothetical predicted protein [Mytilus galloprovincialis]